MGWAIAILAFSTAGFGALSFFVCSRNIQITGERDMARREITELNQKIDDITEVDNEQLQRLNTLHNTTNDNLADYANTQWVPDDTKG